MSADMRRTCQVQGLYGTACAVNGFLPSGEHNEVVEDALILRDH